MVENIGAIPKAKCKVQSAKFKLKSSDGLEILHFTLCTFHFAFEKHAYFDFAFGAFSPPEESLLPHWSAFTKIT